MNCTDQQTQTQGTPMKEMNLDLIAYYVKEHLAGRHLSPNKERLAKAAIELQDAYAVKDKWMKKENDVWPESDQVMYDRAYAAFNGGDGRPMHWGVQQRYIPRNAIEGDQATIISFFLGQRIEHKGKVTRVIDFPTSTGWIIELEEITDYYLSTAPRNKYISLWASHDTRIMAGIMLGT